jgi:crotonobetainyl-CoA:carnitine CoA-transferase CaiB-like acyl-CoA transferase
LIETIFAGMTAAEVVKKLDAAGIANARINTPDEVWDHPQLKARQRWRSVQTPAGTIPALLPPVTMAGFEPRFDAVPAVGEHTDQVLAGLGFSAEAISALHADGAV